LVFSLISKFCFVFYVHVCSLLLHLRGHKSRGLGSRHVGLQSIAESGSEAEGKRSGGRGRLVERSGGRGRGWLGHNNAFVVAASNLATVERFPGQRVVLGLVLGTLAVELGVEVGIVEQPEQRMSVVNESQALVPLICFSRREEGVSTEDV
jgi:hypothetical protein